MSFDDVVDLLDRTPVVAIVTTRANGSPIATPIWSVVVDGVPYLRSAFGPDSWWYRHVQVGRPVSLAMGNGAIAERNREAALALPREPISTVSVPPEDPAQPRIDDALRAKYPPGQSLDWMLSNEAVSCTLRVEEGPMRAAGSRDGR